MSAADKCPMCGLEEGVRWRPINTAPVDEPVLVYDGPVRVGVNGLYPGFMTTAVGTAHQDRMGVVTVSWSLVYAGGYAEDSDVFPTHWHPLPSPP